VEEHTKQETSVRQIACGSACYLLHTVILLGFFDPEEGGDMFLRNVGSLSTDYTSLHHNHRYQNLKYKKILRFR
jgi:hypothetical protein